MKKLSLLFVAVALMIAALPNARAQSRFDDHRGRGFPGRGPDFGRGGPGFGRGPGFDHRGPDFGRGGGRDFGRGGYGDPVVRQASRLVNLLYQAGLFRQVDPAGFNYYVNDLQNRGLIALLEMAQAIGNSPEYKQNVEARFQPRYVLQNFYRTLLGRDPDPSGEQTYLPMLVRCQAGEVLRAIVSSPEFAQKNLY